MNINSSSKCWGYSRRMKNWRKHRVHDDYDIYELISQNAPNTTRTLTDQEVTDLEVATIYPERLHPEIKPEIKPERIHPEIKPERIHPEIKPRIKPLSKPIPKTKPILIDSSTSYS